MSPVFVIFCLIAFLIPVGLCFYYKHVVNKQSAELKKLKEKEEQAVREYVRSIREGDVKNGRAWQALIAEAGIDVVNYEGEYFYNELMKIKESREKLSLEDWKNLHVNFYESKRDDQDDYSPSWSWKEVSQSGCETERRRRLSETCPNCGTHLIEVFVSSPLWTWENRCGREGMLTFCPHCQKQIRFHMERMN